MGRLISAITGGVARFTRSVAFSGVASGPTMPPPPTNSGDGGGGGALGLGWLSALGAAVAGLSRRRRG